jgi:glycosyltransferase involved in cell wall biosynthesis
MSVDRQGAVSVIVTTRNSGQTLEACLDSIRRQTYAATELVVVDNHSSDRTLEIANRLADKVATIGPERSAQRNHGASIASGALILFIDADMVLDPEVVAEGARILGAGTVPAVVIPEETVGEGFWTACRALERGCYNGDDTIEAARFYSRAAFAEAGGFDIHLNGGEDWDLSRRVARGRRPIFRAAYVRNWRTLARHPLLTAGMFTLKAVELAAILDVAADTKFRGGVRDRSHEVYAVVDDREPTRITAATGSASRRR